MRYIRVLCCKRLLTHSWLLSQPEVLSQNVTSHPSGSQGYIWKCHWHFSSLYSLQVACIVHCFSARPRQYKMQLHHTRKRHHFILHCNFTPIKISDKLGSMAWDFYFHWNPERESSAVLTLPSHQHFIHELERLCVFVCITSAHSNLGDALKGSHLWNIMVIFFQESFEDSTGSRPRYRHCGPSLSLLPLHWTKRFMLSEQRTTGLFYWPPQNRCTCLWTPRMADVHLTITACIQH